MHASSLHETVNAMMDIPPAEFRGVADRFTPMELTVISGELFTAVQYLTRASAYMGARQLGFDHEHSVRYAQKAVTAIRKSLGYTYADDDLSF